MENNQPTFDAEREFEGIPIPTEQDWLQYPTWSFKMQQMIDDRKEHNERINLQQQVPNRPA